MKIAFLFFISLYFSYSSIAQNNNPWRGKKACVVLTYDDGYDQQLDNAVPILDSLKLKATFYLSVYFPAVRDRLPEWKKVAAKGHELGNHTLYHPCNGGKGREWVSKEYDLRDYSVKKITDEIRMTNVFLHEIDGKTRRTFAFTCGDMKVQDSFYINGMKNEIVAARAVRSEMHRINEIDLYNIDCYMVNNNTADQMIEWVKKAVETNSLLVILFHGVGGGNSLDVSLTEHRKFLQYLKTNERDLWIAPMIQVADFIKAKNNKH